MPRLFKVDYQVHDVGDIFEIGHGIVPQRSLLCDGSLLLISAYNDLFLKIGTTFGGDGVNNFRLPDMRGRSWTCAGQGPGLSARTRGSTFGTETHTISTTEMPSHGHSYSSGTPSVTSHSHTYLGPQDFVCNTFFESFNAASQQSQTTGSNPPSATAGLHSHTVSTLSGGGSGVPHENLAPCLVCYYAIAY